MKRTSFSSADSLVYSTNKGDSKVRGKETRLLGRAVHSFSPSLRTSLLRTATLKSQVPLTRASDLSPLPALSGLPQQGTEDASLISVSLILLGFSFAFSAPPAPCLLNQPGIKLSVWK